MRQPIQCDAAIIVADLAFDDVVATIDDISLI